MFMGTYFLNMDDSHRLNIPASYKKNLESDLVLSRGIDQDKKCIYLYNRSDWDKFANQLRSLSMLKKDNRFFTREFIGHSYETSLDPKGRLVILKELIPYCNLQKEVVVIGSGDRIEIWDKSTYDKYVSDTEGQLELKSEEIEF